MGNSSNPVSMMNETDITSLNETTKWLWRICGPLIFIPGLIGNFIAMWIFIKLKITSSKAFFHLFILAVTDTAVLFTNLGKPWIKHTFDLEVRNLSDAGCKLHQFFAYTFMDFSGWILVSLAIERRICGPRSQEQSSRILKNMNGHHNRRHNLATSFTLSTSMGDSGFANTFSSTGSLNHSSLGSLEPSMCNPADIHCIEAQCEASEDPAIKHFTGDESGITRRAFDSNYDNVQERANEQSKGKQSGADDTLNSIDESENSAGETLNCIGETENSAGETLNSTGETENSAGETLNSIGETQTNTSVTLNSIVETQKNIGETQNSTSETLNSIGEPQNSTGEILNSIGETQNSAGETLNNIGEEVKNGEGTQNSVDFELSSYSVCTKPFSDCDDVVCSMSAKTCQTLIHVSPTITEYITRL
ncbi:uncharacterized protein LOC121376068 isoform X2 [Gigantopelta aegis]|uniref:uncharacterized protein LOC121376068 isoform X2 n=1 Tax=Gigantopelta aegis TaxID=1735272 RepID=UPI001B88D54D|nr:uncharacterized protein LOC121376068 isoform X2 [Gigantopelta aegis]